MCQINEKINKFLPFQKHLFLCIQSLVSHDESNLINSHKLLTNHST